MLFTFSFGAISTLLTWRFFAKMAIKSNGYYYSKILGDIAKWLTDSIKLICCSQKWPDAPPRRGCCQSQWSHRVTLKRPFHPSWSSFFPKMMTGQIKGGALKQTLIGEPPTSPCFFLPLPLICTLNIWTPSFFHSCKPQPFPSYLHTPLQGKGSFPFYLCWVHRK